MAALSGGLKTAGWRAGLDCRVGSDAGKDLIAVFIPGHMVRR